MEVPKKDHRSPEIVETKKKEIENLQKYEMFKEEVDRGQEKITSRWVITKKTAWDSQKQDNKACLVVRRYKRLRSYILTVQLFERIKQVIFLDCCKGRL